MKNKIQIDYPIAIFFFNRPSKLKVLLNRLNKYQFKKVYFFADGARPMNKSDKENLETCKALVEKYPLGLTNEYIYADNNLGCGKRIKTGLDLFFSMESFGFIFEDDVIPNKNFKFPSSEEIKNLHLTGVTHISLFNPLVSEKRFYSKSFFFIWGWGTWRENWQFTNFNSEEKVFSLWKKSFRKMVFPINIAYVFPLLKVKRNIMDTWDLQYSFVQLSQNGVSYIPEASLIENIGFDEEATHTAKNGKQIKIKGNSDMKLALHYLMGKIL